MYGEIDDSTTFIQKLLFAFNFMKKIFVIGKDLKALFNPWFHQTSEVLLSLASREHFSS